MPFGVFALSFCHLEAFHKGRHTCVLTCGYRCTLGPVALNRNRTESQPISLKSQI